MNKLIELDKVSVNQKNHGGGAMPYSDSHKKNLLYKRGQENLGDILKDTFVARSAASLNILSQVRSLGDCSASVLITGESGTGKEMIAHLCHKHSSRGSGPFVAVNCAALPEGLLESELFGHKKGSFTGAVHESEGLIRKANQGTLFLDEIGDMSLTTQAKLLRVTQDKMVRPVGGDTEIPVNVRIICATHKNLLESSHQGGFRADLYFRLSVIPIFIPPLRHRKDDILPLALHFMNRVSASNRTPPKTFSNEAKERLLHHNWPGNVRELNNVVERAMVYTKGPMIDEGQILFDYQYTPNSEEHSHHTDVPEVNLRSLEILAIKEALKKSNGIKTVAARHLGIDRKTLSRKERQYHI